MTLALSGYYPEKINEVLKPYVSPSFSMAQEMIISTIFPPYTNLLKILYLNLKSSKRNTLNLKCSTGTIYPKNKSTSILLLACTYRTGKISLFPSFFYKNLENFIVCEHSTVFNFVVLLPL